MDFTDRKLKSIFANSSIIFFILLISGIGAGKVHSYPDITADRYTVTGKVSAIRIYQEEREIKELSANSRPAIRGEAVFDTDTGKLRTKKVYDEKGNFQWKNVYSYNESGEVEEWESFDRNGRLKWKYIYSYGENGRLDKMLQYNGSGQIERTTVYQYEDDKLLEELVYNSAGTLQWSKKYTYYDDGILEWSTYYPDGHRIKKVREIYDSSKMKIREIHSGELGSIFEDVHFVYNEEGRITELRIYDGLGRLKELRNIDYDVRGNLIRETKIFSFDDRKAEYEYSYSYDARSNWTEQTIKHYITYGSGDKELAAVKKLYREIAYDESF